MHNLNKYRSQYIGYNKIDTLRMAVDSINPRTPKHELQF